MRTDRGHNRLQLLLIACLIALFSYFDVTGQRGFQMGVKAQRLTDEQISQLSNSLNQTVIFLEGFEIEDIARETYQCLWSGHVTVEKFNQSHIAFNKPDEDRKEIFPRPRDMVFNVTEGISEEIAEFWNDCAMTMVSLYEYILLNVQLYSDKDQYHNYFVSLLQHLLGQAVYLTQVNIILVDAIKDEDWETFYFVLGRLLRSLLIVVPLEKEPYEDDNPFNSKVKELDMMEHHSTHLGEAHHPMVQFTQPRSADEMNWFWVIYFMSKGLGDKTIGHGSTYRATFCYFNARDIIAYASEEIPESAVIFDFSSMVTGVTGIFLRIDPMFKECTSAYDEYYVTALDYGKAFTDLKILALNLAYHTPELYEVIEFLVQQFSREFKNQASEYYYDIGVKLGEIAYWIFYDVDDYSYPGIDISYPREFDDEELNF